MGKTYLAGPPGEWLHPDDHEPPRGSKILMRHRHGCIAIGIWQPDMIAWMPLPKFKPEMRERLIREGKL